MRRYTPQWRRDVLALLTLLAFLAAGYLLLAYVIYALSPHPAEPVTDPGPPLTGPR